MSERQPSGCLCFLRRNHKDGKSVNKGAASAEPRLKARASGNGQHSVTTDSPGGAQLVNSLAPCDTPPAACPAIPPQTTTIPSPFPCITSVSSSPPPPASSCSAIQSPTSVTDPPPPPEMQVPSDTRTSNVLAAANAATPSEEGPQDICILSTTSRASTTYFSARGSSLFSEDGDWLSNGPLFFPHAALTGASDGRPGDQRLRDASNSAAEPSPQQQFHSHELHKLQQSQQQQQHPHVTSHPAQANPQQHKQSHYHNHNDVSVLYELGGAPSGPPSIHGIHNSGTPVALSCPAGQPPKPFIVVEMQEVADARIQPPQKISRDEEGYTEHTPQSLQQQQQQQQKQKQQQEQQQLQDLHPCDPSSNGTKHAALISASTTKVRRDVDGHETGASHSGPAPQGDCKAVLDRVAELYILSGRPCKACQVLLHYCKSQNVTPATLQPELRARAMPDAEKLTKVAQGVSDALADVANDDGWQIVRNDDLKLLYRHVPGQTVHAFRARCDVEAHVQHLVALAREVDLCPSWNKYCTSATVLRERSPTDLVAYITVWMPWPFHDVGFMVEAHGADLYDEEGRMVICFSTPDSKTTGPDAPPPRPGGSEKNRKMRLLVPSCITLEPLPPKSSGGLPRTRCVMQAYIDPNVRHVPPFIITFVLKVLSPFVYAAVLKVLASAFKSPDNPLPKRILQREELYGLIRRRTEAYLKSKEAAAAAGNQAMTGGSVSATPSLPDSKARHM